jgi:hypothetical protein
MPWDEYAALPGASITRLKELKRSPLHYKHALTHPREGRALTIGSAGHCAILEPERFDRDHAVWAERTEGGAMAPRKGKKWDAFIAANDGKRVITEDEHNLVIGMQHAVRTHPNAMRYLGDGDPEVSMRWMNGARLCKGRVDWITTADGVRVLVGLKTSRDARHFAFASQAARLGYHLQWAFYFDGYHAITGTVARVVEIVVEQLPPHAVSVFTIPHDIIEQGREEYAGLFAVLAECEATRSWPGPVPVEEDLTLPSWVYGSEDDDVSELGLEA